MAVDNIDEGIDDDLMLGTQLDVDPEALEAFQKDLRLLITDSLRKMDILFNKHPVVSEAVAEYGLTVQLVPSDGIDFEPEEDSGLH